MTWTFIVSAVVYSYSLQLQFTVTVYNAEHLTSWSLYLYLYLRPFPCITLSPLTHKLFFTNYVQMPPIHCQFRPHIS
jgi:hypothetical protein